MLKINKKTKDFFFGLFFPVRGVSCNPIGMFCYPGINGFSPREGCELQLNQE